MLNRLSNARLEKWIQVLWGLVLLSVPVTSFRWLPSVIGRTLVRPLAFYPLVLLIPVLLLYLMRTKTFRWPRPSAPLIGFILVALISTFAGGLYAPLELRGQTYWGWALRTWISLAIGMGFFWVSVLVSRSEEFLRKSLPWMYAGLVVTILWGGIQAIAQNTSLIDLAWVNKVQLTFSIRPLVSRRVSGLAYEPSWLADQVVMFYFPWLFAALVTRFRVMKYKWFEPVLSLGTLFLLLLTYSRSGLLGLLFAAFVVLLTVGRGLLSKIWTWFWQPLVSPKAAGRAGRVLLLLLIIVLLISAVWWLSRYSYFSSLWSSDLSQGFRSYVQDLAAGPRLAYIESGLEIFRLHPWLGVGMGGSSFYLIQNLPSWAYRDSFEIALLFNPQSNLMPNVRSQYIRLLSETGLIGFWLYIAFMGSILGSIRKMFLSGRKLLVYASIAGLTAWLAIMLRQFTQSSFTSPVIWITLGMVVGYAQQVPDTTGKSEAQKESS